MHNFLTDTARILQSDDKPKVLPFYGVVKGTITDDDGKVTGYQVSLGDDTNIVEARKCAGAKIGDVVLLTLLNSGALVVAATRDGDTDIKDVATDLKENYDTSAEVDRKIGEIEVGESIIQYGTSANTSTDPTNWSTSFVPPTTSLPIAWIRTVNAKGEIIKPKEQATVINNPFIFMSKVGATDSQGNITLIDGGMIKTDTLVVSGDAVVGGTISGTVFESWDGDSYMQLNDGGITFGQLYYGSGLFLGALTNQSLQITDPWNNRTVTVSPSGISVDGNVTAYNIPSGTILTSNNYGSYSDFSGNVYGSNFLGVLGSTSNRHSAYINPGNASQDTCYISTGTVGLLCHSGSLRKWKKDIEDIKDESIDPTRLYDLPVRQFRWREDSPFASEYSTEKLIPGFIAEEMDKHYPIAAVYRLDEEDGEYKLASWGERNLIPAMLKLIQDQHKDIELLKERLDKLSA